MADDHARLHSRRELIRLVAESLKAERGDAAMYRRLAAREKDETRRRLLERLAESEDRHAHTWEQKLKELGVQPPRDGIGWRDRLQIWLAERMGTDAAIRSREAGERVTADRYHDIEQRFGAEAGEVISEIQKEERSHARKLHLLGQQSPAGALSFMLGREHWHQTHQSWLGDAIYGANDGLGAVFGLVSGVAGYTEAGHSVLIAGIFGMIASALSMGAGAYLAAKSEREMYDAEMHRESIELEEQPEEEQEEMRLFYQLKGFTEAEAEALVERLGKDPQQFLRAMASEELGLAGEPGREPVKAAWSAGLSTAAGAMIPVIPFFFMTGIPAIVVAFAISLLAHFAVGAAKTLFTNRPWFWSGLEMTMVGVIEAVVTYGIGVLSAHYL
jgi:VIT1/CCC1 family predicted Fe2+/Mn2+ transporter/rubrerythrin